MVNIPNSKKGIKWCRDADSKMYQFLARHRLSLVQVKRLEKEAEFLTLCTNLNCNFPEDAWLNGIVHEKIICL